MGVSLSLMSLLLVSSIAENPLIDRFRRASLHCQTSSGQTTTRRRLPTDLDLLAAAHKQYKVQFTGRRVKVTGGKHECQQGKLLGLPKERQSHFSVEFDNGQMET